ncbi:MAG: DAK2 domain-containing protein, partial [Lachnospiraceae bacterium]|nr:DAK2 domain-containing protein [Candidatus Merdinaster equi]
MVKRVSGYLLEKMLKNALANIHNSEEKINDLNVFPVPDGDTGTNMYLTLLNGLKRAKGVNEIGAYLKELSEGMLLGARGNSGVILSQIFKGIYAELARCQAANIADMRNAFIRGYKTAYQAVVHPVEGTMLTVAREGIENIRAHLDRNTSIEAFLAMYIAEMKKTLAQTPRMLAVLKEYGVVDSGAVGYITIIEGMYMYLCDKIVEDNALRNAEGNSEGMNAERGGVAGNSPVDISAELFNEFSPFKEGYCTEFVLQRMKSDGYNQKFSIDAFRDDLKLYGNSIVASEDGMRVKVHIHTLKPSRVIALAQEYGEFITFKLENMQIQHNEFLEKRNKVQKLEHSPMAIIAVANGEGIRDAMKKLGCNIVLEGGEKMNLSTQDFIDAVQLANADTVAILPNNKNLIRAAEQAAQLYTQSDIRVLPTVSMLEGYYALTMDLPDDTPDRRIKSMLDGAGNITTLLQTKASRDYEHNGIGCKNGEEIALINDRLVFACDNMPGAVLGG